MWPIKPQVSDIISQEKTGADLKKIVNNEDGQRNSGNHDTDMQITAVWRTQIETETLAGERGSLKGWR